MHLTHNNISRLSPFCNSQDLAPSPDFMAPISHSFMTATAGLAMDGKSMKRECGYNMVIYRRLARLALILCTFAGLNAVSAQSSGGQVSGEQASGAQLNGAQAIETQATAPAVTPPVIVPAAGDLENTLYLDLSTGGRVTIKLFPIVAPNHVERIKTLARKGFYNGVVFHRVIDGFMAQSGDPTGTGQGGSDLPDLKAEFNASPDSANSQFFICFQPRFSLDKKYTVFGRVTSGMEYVDAIARGEPPATPDRIVKATIAADVK
jgi:cyclophilin family peptidyl-prolyl cis-trans isomerase